jgi:hypothetical protein
VKPRTLIATTTLLAVLVLSICTQASAASTGATYRRDLTEVELQLRYGIELGPAELEGNIAFSANLCLAAKTAEAADEAPTAEVDWRGLEYVVHRHDLALTTAIAATLHGADRRIAALDRLYSKAWHGSPAVVRDLHRAVASARSGLLRLQVGLGEFRRGFHRFLHRDCAGAEVAIAGASRPIRRGLVRIDSGMGLLWLLAEPSTSAPPTSST